MKQWGIKKYFTLWLALMRRDMMAAMAYRLQFWADTLGTLVWTLIQLSVLKLMFQETPIIGGWDFWHVLLLFTYQQLAFYFTYMFVYPAIKEFAEQIRQGTFDWVITRPLDSQFFVATQKFRFSVLFSFITVIFFYFYVLSHITSDFNWVRIFISGLLFICSISILSSILYIAASTMFWFVRGEALNSIVYSSLDIGRYPRRLYTGWIKYLFTFFWPFALLFNIPAEMALGLLTVPSLLIFLMITAVFAYVSRKFWLYSIKHYSSASS